MLVASPQAVYLWGEGWERNLDGLADGLEGKNRLDSETIRISNCRLAHS
jgi:hypothetical protein